MVPGVSDGAGESILTVMSATWSCLPKRRVLTVAEATAASVELTEPPAGPADWMSRQMVAVTLSDASRSAIQKLQALGSTRRTMGPARTGGRVAIRRFVRRAPGLARVVRGSRFGRAEADVLRAAFACPAYVSGRR